MYRVIGPHQIQRIYICSFSHCHKHLKLKLQSEYTGGTNTQSAQQHAGNTQRDKTVRE